MPQMKISYIGYERICGVLRPYYVMHKHSWNDPEVILLGRQSSVSLETRYV
jgi:hypothetical protein